MRTIPLLGTLTQDLDIPEWWESAPVPVPYFSGTPVPFVIEEEWQGSSYPPPLESAIAAFLALTDDDRIAASEAVDANYREAVDDGRSADLGVEDPTRIWEHVTPVEVHVRRRPLAERDFYIQIDCNCAWEKEHGLQIVYHHGSELVRVSDQDGHLTEEDAE
jgi:hypothetical protein